MSVALLIRPAVIDHRDRAAIESAHRILHGCAPGSKPGKQPRVAPGARGENCGGSWDIDKRNAPRNFLPGTASHDSALHGRCRDRGTRRAILRHAVECGDVRRGAARANAPARGVASGQSPQRRARKGGDLARSIFRENVHALRRFAADDWRAVRRYMCDPQVTAFLPEGLHPEMLHHCGFAA